MNVYLFSDIGDVNGNIIKSAIGFPEHLMHKTKKDDSIDVSSNVIGNINDVLETEN